MPAVKVAQVNVNPLTGNYSLSLPAAAPHLLVHTNQLITPLNFQAQPAGAGKWVDVSKEASALRRFCRYRSALRACWKKR